MTNLIFSISLILAVSGFAFLWWKQKQNFDAQKQGFEESFEQFKSQFSQISSEALQNNNKNFLDLAQTKLEQFEITAKKELGEKEKAIDHLVKPLQDSLKQVSEKIQALENKRLEAYTSITEQVKSLASSQQKLQGETANLVKALRAPQVRGRWGEMTLKRVAELAGMTNHCDFFEQTNKTMDSGSRLRPDMVVKLPQGRQIIVDAKCPLQDYLNALEEQDEIKQKEYYAGHARQLQTHLKQLSQKSYWDQFKPTPEFVVMFVPGENFFSAALKQNPELIEEGVKQGVILATPTTLISLLKSVSYGWRQESLAENAAQISKLGKEMFDRVCTLSGHLEKLGRSLHSSVDHYNKTLGTYETRILTSAKKFQELGIKGKSNIENIPLIEKQPRALQPVSEEDSDIKSQNA
jgi:DNA recombination protein RmuC